MLGEAAAALAVASSCLARGEWRGFPNSLDYGIYFFAGEGQDRVHERADVSSPCSPQTFDASKPETVIYVDGYAGFQTDRNWRRRLETDREATNATLAGHDTACAAPGFQIMDYIPVGGWDAAGFNLGILHWDQFSDTLTPLGAEQKIWDKVETVHYSLAGLRSGSIATVTVPRNSSNDDGRSEAHGGSGVSGDVDLREEQKRSETVEKRSLAEVIADAYEIALSGYKGRVRLVGHSLGAQMALALTDALSSRRHKRRHQAKQNVAGKDTATISPLVPDELSSVDGGSAAATEEEFVIAPMPSRIAMLDPFFSSPVRGLNPQEYLASAGFGGGDGGDGSFEASGGVQGVDDIGVSGGSGATSNSSRARSSGLTSVKDSTTETNVTSEKEFSGTAKGAGATAAATTTATVAASIARRLAQRHGVVFESYKTSWESSGVGGLVGVPNIPLFRQTAAVVQHPFYCPLMARHCEALNLYFLSMAFPSPPLCADLQDANSNTTTKAQRPPPGIIVPTAAASDSAIAAAAAAGGRFVQMQGMSTMDPRDDCYVWRSWNGTDDAVDTDSPFESLSKLAPQPVQDAIDWVSDAFK